MTIARFKIVLGVKPEDCRVTVDGKRLEHLVSAVRVTANAGDLPVVSLDFPSDRVEIEGDASIAGRLVRRMAGWNVVDITSMSDQSKRWTRPRSFWRLHFDEARRAFAR